MAQSGDYTPITIYRSETADTLPLAGNLSVGEIAVNIADRKLYTKNSSEEVVELSGGNDHTHEAADIIDLASVVNEIINQNGFFRVAVEEKTAAFTLSPDDENKILLCTDSATPVTLPQDSDEDIPVGAIYHLYQTVDGTPIQAQAGTGATLNSVGQSRTRDHWSSITLIKYAEDSWVCIGDQEL